MRVDAELLKRVQELAKNNGVTVTHLVDQYFRSLVDEHDRPKTDEELGVEQA